MKLSKEKKAQALEDLKIYNGLPPHDGWSNHCYGDGYFAASLVRKYGMSIEELEKVTEYRKISKKWHTLRNKFIKEE